MTETGGNVSKPDCQNYVKEVTLCLRNCQGYLQ